MKISIQSKNLAATFSTLGAELISLNTEDQELIWQGKDDFWQGHAPILFPICGFLKNEQYSYNGEVYSMPVHGFTAQSTFEVANKSAKAVTFLLKDSEDTRSQYPFPFELKVTYTIDDARLSVLFEVKNSGTKAMPFSLGWHPAFNLCYPAKVNFDKENNATRRQVSKDGLIGRGSPFKTNSIELDENTFAHGGIVLQHTPTKKVMLECPDHTIRLDNSQFPNLVLWGQPTADFICLEPWCGMGDQLDGHGDIKEKEDIILLDAAETWTAKTSLEMTFN